MPVPTLQDALSELYADAIIRQAETIRGWTVGRERHEQAAIHVRLALWEQQMGRITDEVLQRIYSTLHFVMPDDGTFADETVPLDVLEKEAAWETAYYEQLAQRECPDCGDGLCPVDDSPPLSHDG